MREEGAGGSGGRQLARKSPMGEGHRRERESSGTEEKGEKEPLGYPLPVICAHDPRRLEVPAAGSSGPHPRSSGISREITVSLDS